MKIDNSSIAMTGQSARVETYTKEESLQVWGDSSQTKNQNNFKGISIDISEHAKALSLKMSELKETQMPDWEISDKDKDKIYLLQKMIEFLTGKKMKFYMPKGLKQNRSSHNAQAAGSQGHGNIQQKKGWGVIYNSYESYSEHEVMTFSAKGKVQTADGRTINLEVDLNMSRSFAYSNSISFRAGDAVMVDPLVINLGNSIPGLTDEKFEFDLDSDGIMDLISFPEYGSGFIALDLNDDGIINDGRELFGTQTGDGFHELSQYDNDGNGWIDENDPIFDKLRIWTKDENGDYKLFALGQKGVGAIYLGNVETDFGLKNSGNEALGEIKKTGIYLNENGSAGTIQHIDIAI